MYISKLYVFVYIYKWTINMNFSGEKSSTTKEETENWKLKTKNENRNEKREMKRKRGKKTSSAWKCVLQKRKKKQKKETSIQNLCCLFLFFLPSPQQPNQFYDILTWQNEPIYLFIIYSLFGSLILNLNLFIIQLYYSSITRSNVYSVVCSVLLKFGLSPRLVLSA